MAAAPLGRARGPQRAVSSWRPRVASTVFGAWQRDECEPCHDVCTDCSWETDGVHGPADRGTDHHVVEPDGPPADKEYHGPRLVGGGGCGQKAEGGEQDEPDDDRQRPGDGSDNDGRSRDQGDGQGGPAGSVQPGPSEALFQEAEGGVERQTAQHDDTQEHEPGCPDWDPWTHGDRGLCGQQANRCLLY